MNPTSPDQVLRTIAGLINELNLSTEELYTFLDTLASNEEIDVMTWINKNVAATFPGLEGNDPEYELEWA